MAKYELVHFVQLEAAQSQSAYCGAAETLSDYLGCIGDALIPSKPACSMSQHGGEIALQELLAMNTG